jgi:purine-nucleoside phosphorylase
MPLPVFTDLDSYHISPADVVQTAFHCKAERIRPDVILFPWWHPTVLEHWVDSVETITPDVLYEVVYRGKAISVVRSGIGAPQAGDMTLALGLTGCKRLLFAGSVGGLRPEMKIGDILIPRYSLAGDGFCRYLQPGLPLEDCFLEQVSPDAELSTALERTAEGLVREGQAALHRGPVYCTDSILAQFGKLDWIQNELRCVGIEMESAAVFKAARLVGIQAAALMSLSDVPANKQTLFAGRSTEERQHRDVTRSQILAKALLDCLTKEIQYRI